MPSCVAFGIPGHPRRSVIAGQHPGRQRWRGLPLAELQPPLRRRLRRRLHAHQGRAERALQHAPAARANLPGGRSTGPRYLGKVTGSPAPQLLGRVHVADAERAYVTRNRDRVPTPTGSRAATRGSGPPAEPTDIQPVRRPEPGRAGSGTSPRRSRSSRTTGGRGTSTRGPRLLRLEPGQPGEPRRLGGMDGAWGGGGGASRPGNSERDVRRAVRSGPDSTCSPPSPPDSRAVPAGPGYQPVPPPLIKT